MIKTRLLNSEIWKHIATLGHFDKVCICDAGLPIEKHLNKVDLAIEFGKPSFIEVLEIILFTIKVQKVYFAQEFSDINKKIFSKFNNLINDAECIERQTISHEELKSLSKQCVLVIRTGENTPYSNVILEAGVTF